MADPLPPLDHLLALSDDVGIVQHATYSVSNRSTGYCTDDVSRALMVALARMRLAPHDGAAAKLASTYLAFLLDAQLPDGRFHNFMSYRRDWLDEVGTQDSCGRAMWALGYAMRFAPRTAWQRACAAMLERAIQCVDWLEHPRSQAYATLGLSHAAWVDPTPGFRLALEHLSGELLARYERERGAHWDWLEPSMTYDNGRLPEALLRSGIALDDPYRREAGSRMLAFLEEIVFEDGTFVPIGNEGWFERGGARARFAQQPLEAAAMVDAELAAFAATAQSARLTAAERASAWFEGRNLRGAVMAHGGGCYDGLEEYGPNRNMGAESTIAYLSAAYALAEQRNSTLHIVRSGQD